MAKLRVADLNIEVEYKYPTMVKQAEAYKADFDKPVFKIFITDENLEELKKENPHLSYDDLEYIFTGAGFYECLISLNGFMLHSSGVCVDGYAYLFSADSGTGKSTHTGLWQEYFGEDRALIINDDKPAIRQGEDGQLYVYGTPWSGKTDKNLNLRLPIGAIVFLERSQTNYCHEISVKEAIPLILEQTLRPAQRDKMVALLDTLDKLLQNVKVYRLGCDMSYDAVKTSYEAIRRV